MSFPGRPPIVPGIPIPPAIGMPPYMPPIMPPVMTMPPIMPSSGTIPIPQMRTYRPPVTANNTNTTAKYSVQPPKRVETGPSITVFVGNIVEHAPDMMVRHILSACGHVISWKRIQGFGFCEFGSPESALRAVRLLHDLDIGGKKLVVKVDAKTKVILDDYKKEERKKQGKNDIEGKGEEGEIEDYLDDNMKRIDASVQEKVVKVLEDFDSEMKTAAVEKNEEALKLKKEIEQNMMSADKSKIRSQEILMKLSQEHSENPILKDGDFEDGKRDLISREIGKFREIMKKQEAEREEERQRRELLEKERGDRLKQERERDRGRSRSTPLSPSRSRSRSKSLSPGVKHRNNKIRRNRTRTRSRSRERDRDRNDRDRERDRERERDKEKSSKRDLDKAAAREREEEEEANERKKHERKARQKEASYQERLRSWESRERRKNKEYEKEKDRERYKEEEMEREAKKLKEFLEDYDDDRDDAKYYKGRELQRRLAEREREKELDAKDRQKEKEELEELRNKIMDEDHEDPTSAYEKILREREELYKPKILIDVNAEQIIRQKEREKEEKERQRLRELEKEREREEIRLLEERRIAEREMEAQKNKQLEEDEESDDDRRHSSGRESYDADNQDNTALSVEDHRKSSKSPHSHSSSAKKKKLDVKEVFNTDDDEDSNIGSGKRRKLVPLDYGEEKEKEHRRKAEKKEEKKEDVSKSQEEKRKHIKSLIDKIPTEKNALFAFSIDWAAVDNQLMERRIRPWINKKIIEYIGEPEPTLVDFICSKVLAGSQPQGILDDVQMVLDEEAEVFVVKMWRLLIYEIEAKKLGLVK